MLRSLNDLESYTIGATNGQVGQVTDFYFDDLSWTVRYLIVDTGTWLSSRKVLISPISVREADWANRTLAVSISQEQVKNSPDIDTDQPVSRQHESQYLGYYGYAPYWDGGGLWGAGMYPYAMAPGYMGLEGNRLDELSALEAYTKAERQRISQEDPHLRSAKAVVGYHIHATDGEIGHVADILVDDETWAIRYLVVNTSNWWVGHKVLVAPSWITGVHWADQHVSVDMSREAIQSAPAYDSSAALDRDREAGLYLHHERKGYWA
jgi:sporulation protein YlmC with PRC-barrel domain